MKPYPFSGLNHFTVPCGMRIPSFAQTRQPGALHVQGRELRCQTEGPPHGGHKTLPNQPV
jgi:hypothetical protein